MLLPLLKPLIVNFTIIFSLAFNANLFLPFRSRQLSMKDKILYGLFASFTGLLCMLYPIETLGATHFDLRMVIIVVITLYCGAVSGLLTTFIISFTRLIIGGEYAYVGIFVSVLAFIVAISMRQFFLRSSKRVLSALVIIFIYFLIYIYIISILVTFLDITFYIVYYFSFFGTYVGLIVIIEKMIELNRRFDEVVYLDKLSSISHMAASFAHEIRNPITTVKGFIQFLREDTKDEKLKEFSPLILEELERTNNIITDYINLAKPSTFKLAEMNIHPIIKDTVTLLQPLAIHENVHLYISSDTLDYSVIADKQYLKQCFMNIIKNSIEACEEKGYVKISITETTNEEIEISFEDNGIGLSQDEIKKLGLPYFTTKSKGTGIGSMVTNKLIKEMNGKIIYDSKLGKGTKVVILLPKAN